MEPLKACSFIKKSILICGYIYIYIYIYLYIYIYIFVYIYNIYIYIYIYTGNEYNPNNIGLYRDDGIAIFINTSGRSLNKLKRFFKKCLTTKV